MISFINLVVNFDYNGVLIFGFILDIWSFEKFIVCYSCILIELGSRSWIYLYVNFVNYFDFFVDKSFNEVFFYFILIVLILYCVGGLIRVVDV